jgi:hypothetical protein
MLSPQSVAPRVRLPKPADSLLDFHLPSKSFLYLSAEMKNCPLSLAIIPAVLAAALATSAHGQITVGLPGSAADDSSISLAGHLLDNVFVPITAGAGHAQISEGAVPPQNLGTFDIVIVPGAALAGNAAALAAFNRAALAWEARIADPITVTINADLAPLGAGIIGSTSSMILQGSFNTIRNAMVADSADEADDTIVASLPTAAQFLATVPASPASSLSGNVLGTKANLKALGFPDLDALFGVSDGSITFSTNFSFDFDNSDGVGAGLMDFETVAAHEIGHALGFFSIVDSVNAGQTSISPNTMDLFRFANNTANDPTTAADFTTFARNLVPGVDAINDEINGAIPELRMSTGLTTAFAGTDGRQASHFKADELTGNFIGIMDPTLSYGQYYGPQNTDMRVLDLIGYEIVQGPIPEPSVISALLLGSALLAGRRRARQ